MLAPLLSLVIALPFGCKDKSNDDTGEPGSEDTDTQDTDTQDTDTNTTCEPHTVDCVDEMILDLALHDDLVSDRDVTTTTDGDDYVTLVDATGGGYSQFTNEPWVYIRFTDAGAERVELDDESALESSDWDMALRRFILRLNGGTSGPSCVGAVAATELAYESITEEPAGLSYLEDEFYSSNCTIINDSSGLENSPQVVMAPWWSYPGCVATTAVPFFIRNADGRVLKLRVESYYSDDQDVCNNTGVSPSGTTSAMITLRWAWL